MKLTLRKSELDDWYVIERLEHDGREWMERTGPNAMAMRCSLRITDADVEGTREEMLAIADAIEHRQIEWFKRVAVDATTDEVGFTSPRNSQEPMARVTREEALALVDDIRKQLGQQAEVVKADSGG